MKRPISARAPERALRLSARAPERALRPTLQLPLVDALMREQTGLTVRHLHAEERLRVMTSGMRKAGFSDDAAYALFLRTYPASLLDLASQLSVGETYFFRDPEQLRVFTDVVLPRLLVERPPDHVLSLWSAGCASGEEAYTLAMLLDERGLLERARIVGTDISEASMARARGGVFSPWSLRATPKLALQRYFRKLERDYVLSPAIVQRVRFERQGLTDEHAPLPAGVSAPFDLIFCRNVLIYFTEQGCLAASQRLANSLADGGALFAGPSDPFIDVPSWTRQTSQEGLIFVRGGKPLPAHPPGTSGLGPRVEPSAATSARSQAAERFSARSPEGEHRQQPAPMPTPSAPRTDRRDHDEPRAQESTPEPAQNALDMVRAVGKHEGNERAVEACQQAIAAAPEAVELYVWVAALLLELGREDEAEAALRTLLYLDRKLVIGHLLSALLARRRGDHARAARAYKRVLDLCAAHAEEEPVPMGEGLDHGTLAENAAAELRALDKLARAL